MCSKCDRVVVAFVHPLWLTLCFLVCNKTQSKFMRHYRFRGKNEKSLELDLPAKHTRMYAHESPRQGAAKWDLHFSSKERKSIITRTYDSCSFIIVFTIANLIYFIRASRRYITY
jgi:hypothetical protein